MQVGKRGRERSSNRTQEEETWALGTAYTEYNAWIGMHSKPSRTPGNVSHTVLYNAIFLPHGTAWAEFNCAGEARATYRKSLTCEKTFTNENTRNPANIDRQTTPSRNLNGVRWLGSPTYPSVTVVTPQSVICGEGRLGLRKKNISSLGSYMTIGTQEGLSG